MIDPQFQTMLDAEARAAPPDMPPLDLLPREMIRGGYRLQRAAQNVNSIPEGVEARDLELGSIPGRLYIPAEAVTPGPCLVYFHGGGWVIGDLETHDAHCRRLAAYSGARVLAVDYRLAPGTPLSRRSRRRPRRHALGPSTTPPRSASIPRASASAATAPAAISPPRLLSTCAAIRTAS